MVLSELAIEIEVTNPAHHAVRRWKRAFKKYRKLVGSNLVGS